MSPAASSTERPAAVSRRATLPMVVVLPDAVDPDEEPDVGRRPRVEAQRSVPPARCSSDADAGRSRSARSSDAPSAAARRSPAAHPVDPRQVVEQGRRRGHPDVGARAAPPRGRPRSASSTEDAAPQRRRRSPRTGHGSCPAGRGARAGRATSAAASATAGLDGGARRPGPRRRRLGRGGRRRRRCAGPVGCRPRRGGRAGRRRRPRARPRTMADDDEPTTHDGEDDPEGDHGVGSLTARRSWPVARRRQRPGGRPRRRSPAAAAARLAARPSG